VKEAEGKKKNKKRCFLSCISDNVHSVILAQVSFTVLAYENEMKSKEENE